MIQTEKMSLILLQLSQLITQTQNFQPLLQKIASLQRFRTHIQVYFHQRQVLKFLLEKIM